MRVLRILLCLGLLGSTAHAATYTVGLTTTAEEEAGLQYLYTNACTDRVRSGQAALGGCTVTGTGETSTCTCTPNATQIQNALSVFLKGQLFNRYFNVLDREAGIIRSLYPSVLTQAERDAIKAICVQNPGCILP